MKKDFAELLEPAPAYRYLQLFGALLVALLCVRAGNTQQPAFISDSLDRYIQQGMKDWNIPGLSIAIVKDGRTVVMKGFGVRDVKTGEPVDEQTLFIIASNTKLITGTVLANLHHQGKLSLNDRVTKYHKDFKLYDEEVGRLATIRDLLSHRLGLKTFHGDLANWNTKYSRQQIVYNMRMLPPVGQFRQDYGYSNSAFVAAGEIVPLVTGKPWASYVQETILTPLGMTRTFPVIAGIEVRGNAAKPYTDAFRGQLVEMPYDQIDNLGPAGGMVSCVADMARWMQLQLDSGRYGGKRILPWEVLRETRKVNTIISSEKSSTLPAHFVGYGLGVIMSDFAGRQIYRHTGGVFGFLTSTCFVPEENLGIVIMTNNDNQGFYEMLRVQLLDAYLGVPYTNRSQQALPAHRSKMEAWQKEWTGYRARIGKEKLLLPIKAYEGTYTNELDGTVSLRATDARTLKVTFNNHVNLSATMQYMDNGEWLIVYDNIDYGFFKTGFELQGGKPTALSLRVSDFVDYDTYRYTKQ